MQTIAHEFLPVSSRSTKIGVWQCPPKTIALLVCVALSMSACKTTSTFNTDNSQQPATYAHLEPEEAARDLFSKGQALIRQGKKQEAFATLDELDHRFGQDPRHSVRAILAQALSLKAQSSASPTESLDIQVEIGRRYGEDIDPAMRKQIVTAMFNQAAALAKEGNLSDAIPIYREIEQTYGNGNSNEKSWGAWALFYQGDLQRQMRNPKAASAAYDRLDQRFAQETDPATRALVADALLKKGETLAEQGNIRAAIAAYGEVDRRYAEDRDASFRLRAVRALFAKGSLLGKQGMGDEPDKSENQGTGIKSTGDPAAAVAVYDDIIQRFGRDKDPSIHNIIGGTLFKKSETLRLTGDDQGTIAVYDVIVDRFGNDDAQVSRVLVATALFRKGLALGKQEGASNAAIATFEELIQRFASDTHPNVRKIIGQAITAKQRLITEMEPVHDN